MKRFRYHWINQYRIVQFIWTTWWRFKSAWWAFGKGMDVKEYCEGEHLEPADCPSYYDGCNCVTSIWTENERLLKMVRDRNPNDLLKKII